MATLTQKIEAEQKLRELLADNELPEPDEVEYGHTCIRALWHDSRTCVVVDLDEPDDGFDPDDRLGLADPRDATYLTDPREAA